MSRPVAPLFGLILAFSATLFAQEFRATVLGLVSDSTGALIPNASISITNTETGVVSTTTTGAEGNYVVPFLLPGRYSIRVEAGGFKSVTRTPVDLRVNDRTRVDFKLELGNVSENVTVTASTPLLEVASSNHGQVVENRNVTDLPFNAHNPLTLIGIATGVQYTGSGQYFRAFDNGAINAFSINGGRSGINEYQLDGTPNNAILVNQSPNMCSGFTPPLEAVREFKIMTTTYDAQYGRTGGGIVTIETKSGANAFHGAGSYFMRRPWIEANTFTNNASGAPKAQRRVDHLNLEIDGPVLIPRLYRGKDRTFFTFAYEYYKERLPQPLTGSVPTALQRNGDFSKTYTAAGALFTIYDPLTVQANPAFDATKAVTLANLQYKRTPFAGNLIPANRQSAVARRILQDIPAANQAGDTPSGLNNWFADAYTLNKYPAYIGRVDHSFNEKVRGYARWYHAFRDGTQTDYWAWGTPATRALYGNYKENGAVADVVAALSPTTVLDFRASFTRFLLNSTYKPADLASLGFPQRLVNQLQVADLYPMITFDNYMQVGNTLWDKSPSETYSAQASLLKVVRNHSLKMGAEFRLMRLGDAIRTYGSGTYAFTSSWTSSNPQVADPAAGNSMASFLLGTMASGSAYINAAPYVTWKYPALYLQDDWQLTHKLTLNLGLRWDYETPAVDRFDRQTRGFDYTAASPVQVPGYNLKGGLLFAGMNGQERGAFDKDLRNWQPRAGLAYRMFTTHPLVFRAGIGRYFLPTSEYGGTTGYSQVTTAQTSTSAYLPYQTFDNPFPNGLTQPTGSAQGLGTGLGTAISFSDPSRVIPAVWQFSAGFQYEVKPGLLAELSYVGSRTSRVQVNQNINALTKDQLALGTAYLSQSVANPFYGVLPSNTSMGAQATVQRRSLLLPYPQFSGVTANYRSLGESWYNSMQAKLERRLRNGFSFLVSYTYSKTMQATSFLNAQDTELARQLTTFDVPHRLVVTGLYELPFGPKKPLGGSGWMSHIVGNWQFSWNLVMQSGNPMPLPSGYSIMGDARLSSGQTMNHWFNTSKEIWVSQPPDTLRTAPLVASTIRAYTKPQLNANLMREIRITERHRLQLKASAYNATNTPTFNFPNTTPTSPLFGVIPTTQANLPRSTELGLRYSF